MPIGAPRPGGMPIGGPMGGRIPGGGPIIPTENVRTVGAPAMLAPAAAAATVPLLLTCCDGPPTPLTGPARPAGAWAIGAPAGTPLPAALPTPGPPATPARGTRAIPVCPSTVIETSDCKYLNKLCFQSMMPYLIFLNSSQSHKMRFMCLSNALNVPMNIRPSCNIQRIR
uniref:Uncharacterized protein n=1 Tax=Pygocentrus nattereri TaxID=42514 RepID=A0A3B4CJ21_PYGNA